MAKVVDAVDRFQRRHPVISMPLAVIYKFFEDQGNYLAAIVTYYAFIAIFPLLLLASSILGFFLEDNPELQAELLDSVLGQFPIIGDELGQPNGVQGSTGAIIVGSLAALYGAVGLGQAIQNVSNTAWSVPRNSRPNPFLMRAKSLLLLMTAGVAVIGVVVVSAVLTNNQAVNELVGSEVQWLISLASILVVGTVLTSLFRVSVAGDQPILRAAPGAFAVAIMWQALQYLGAAYVSSVLVNTSSMNQTFGLVLGLIGFIYIAAVMAVIGIELNVVLARKLYPRALLTPFTDRVNLTDADQRAYTGYARAQRLKGFQVVDVSFGDGPVGDNTVPSDNKPAPEPGGQPEHQPTTDTEGQPEHQPTTHPDTDRADPAPTPKGPDR